MRSLSNIDKIAEAFVEVCRSLPNAYLVFAAPASESYDDYKNKVKEILNRSSLTDNARFVGDIPHTEIADYFRLADVTVSIPDTDGTPMTVLESMACRTPTVIGNLSDYDVAYFENEKTTLMVDVQNPQMIAEAVLRLLQDEPLSDKIALEARRRVETDGSYESQMSKMESLYQSLMV
jgi:glycosyltransferase involved in cell wall biosynthesis